ncbi:MAG: phospholipase A, partial [Salinicola sp.]|nr:phospholipase A [Salinicola sp.]
MTPIRSLRHTGILLLGMAATSLAVAQDSSTSSDPVQQANDQAEVRRNLEAETAENPLAITTYRRNYILPWTYNSNPDESDFR